MAGPGGGSSGGGFGGGSFGGGGSHGGGFSGGGGFGGGSFGGGGNHGGFGGGPRPGPGGFGGGPHRPPHHHGPHHHGGFFGPGWHVGYGPHFGGGGCFTGIIGIGVFLAVFVFIILTVSNTPDYSYTYGEEQIEGVIYDEATMQDYADGKYRKYFGDSEDNILLVFLSNEEADGYYTIAWIGDNVSYEINEMFGEYTEYGEALSSHINENYFAYSLDTDLASVVKEMSEHIKERGLSSNFADEKEKLSTDKSKFYNFTSFDLSTQVVDTALKDFTSQTGIPMVIVVDSAEEVFGGGSTENVTTIVGGTDGKTQTTISGDTPVTVGVFLIVLLSILASIFIGFFIAKKSLKKKENKKDDMPWES